jgi:hypothetical protein
MWTFDSAPSYRVSDMFSSLYHTHITVGCRTHIHGMCCQKLINNPITLSTLHSLSIRRIRLHPPWMLYFLRFAALLRLLYPRMHFFHQGRSKPACDNPGWGLYSAFNSGIFLYRGVAVGEPIFGMQIINTVLCGVVSMCTSSVWLYINSKSL